MSVTFERKTNRTVADLERVAKKFAGLNVKVGFLRPQNPRPKDPPEKPKVTNSLLGYVHENGSPANGIPARPFLRPAMMSNEKYVSEKLNKALSEDFLEDRGAVPKAMEVIGTHIRDAAKRNITQQNGFVPLAPSTLKQRAAVKKKRTKALIDTGQLRNAIHYKVDHD
jgi:hypothetical protein